MKLERENLDGKMDDIEVVEYLMDCLGETSRKRGELENISHRIEKISNAFTNLLALLIDNKKISTDEAFNLSQIDDYDTCEKYWKNGKRMSKY